MISLEKKYRTRDGYPVRLLTVTQGPVGFPVVGVMADTNVSVWRTDGKHDCFESRNLIEVRSAEDVVREMLNEAAHCGYSGVSGLIVAALREAGLLKEDA